MKTDTTTQRHLLRAAVATALAMSASFAIAQSGEFTYVIGVVEIQRGNTTIQAMRGTKVFPNDIVSTRAAGMAQLEMVDKARLSLRSNSQLRIEKYPTTPSETGVVLSLVKGTLRSFTTLLAQPNRNQYQMRTRVATVGIRGSGNIMSVSDDENSMLNHTIEGSHEVRSTEGNCAPRAGQPNQSGCEPIITLPNQTVQVVRGLPPAVIPTPPGLLVAGSTMVGSGTAVATAAALSGEGTPPPPQNTGSGNIVGGNGLGFTLVDTATQADPLQVQAIAIASGGAAFTDQSALPQMTLENTALRAYTAYAGSQSGTSLNVVGGSATEVQTVDVGGGNKVVFGRITNPTSVSFSAGSSVTNNVHFAYGGSGFPAYLSEVLTGTVSYTRAGATTPTNQLGTLGQLVSTVLDVNFTARTLNATIGVSMPAGNGVAAGSWTLQATNLPFVFNTFIAFTGDGRLTLTNGNGQNSNVNGGLSGSLEGSFVGSGLNGAIVGYGIQDQTAQSASGSFQSINGVVVFSGPTQATSASYRDGLVSDPRGLLTAASYIRSFATTNRPDEVTANAQGSVSAFAAPSVSGNRIIGHQPYNQGSATVSDNGLDATTGLVWGRWSGGTATVGGSSTSLANTSLHYIFGPTQNGPVSLPLTGTATYDVIGSTRPTDNQGHVGTMNSATLAANFTAKTVDASVNISINGQTWNGSATAMPIYRDQYFSAYAGAAIPGVPSPTAFNITCTPNCTPGIRTGSLDGFFTGRGAGAGVMYNMSGNAGAIAFRRRG